MRETSTACIGFFSFIRRKRLRKRLRRDETFLLKPPAAGRATLDYGRRKCVVLGGFRRTPADYSQETSLSYFDDARREAFPVMKTALDWNDLEKFFIEEKNKLLHNLEKGLYLD